MAAGISTARFSASSSWGSTFDFHGGPRTLITVDVGLNGTTGFTITLENAQMPLPDDSKEAPFPKSFVNLSGLSPNDGTSRMERVGLAGGQGS